MPEINIEIVFALPDRQSLLELSVERGTTVLEAVRASKLKDAFPDDNVESLSVGIWGRTVSSDQKLKDGDRIEIYRPLALDPREARRQLASVGETMGSTAND